MERALGIEQIQMAQTKALLPASWFNRSQIGVKYQIGFHGSENRTIGGTIEKNLQKWRTSLPCRIGI